MSEPRVDMEERARRYVARMPAAVSGTGGHDATFYVACALVQGFGFSIGQAWPLLLEYNGRCDPPWNERELRHKLAQAEKAQGFKSGGVVMPRGCLAKGGEFVPNAAYRVAHQLPEPKRPEFDRAKLEAFASMWAQKVDSVWLADRSAVDPCTVTAAGFLELLYPEGEKVCVFTAQFAATLGRGVELWPQVAPAESGREGVWFLAQPVDGEYHPTEGRTQEGEEPKMSCRSKEAITAWRYLVLESDEAEMRAWMGALVQLPLRITAIYSSGGRSVHALVRVDARTKDEWDAKRDAMRDVLVTLGADPKAMTAVRLTRLPGCWREGKGLKDGRYERFPSPRLQKLFYVNPNPGQMALEKLMPRRNVAQYWQDRGMVLTAAQLRAGPEDAEFAAVLGAVEYYASASEPCRQLLADMEECHRRMQGRAEGAGV